ncbi:MAG: pyridoxal phosphate-dependent aminotransferase [Gemmatimonadota bacterium]|nr:pyridoxal phosphate-dependent aminotransferase [Gemmatimonadota bacterium]
MNYSENVLKLQPSATIAVSTLAKKLAAEGRDIINLGAGEPDFPTPPWVSSAGVEAIQAGQTRYTPAAGTPALRAAVGQYMAGGTGHSTDAQCIVVTAGAKQALFNACFCLFGPGDDVLIGSPYWTSYPEIVNLARARPVPVFGDEDRGFKLSPEDLERAYTPAVKGLIISSPSNPSGAVYTSEELAAIADWCRSHGVIVISDEIYREIYFGSEGVRAPGLLDLPAASLGPVVIVNGMSKSFAMTGWRIGFSWADPDLTKKMSALQSHVSSNASTPSQSAALRALTEPELARTTRSEMVAAFRRRRDLVMGLFDELAPRCEYVRPEGAFYLYFRVDPLFEGSLGSSADVCTRLLEDVGVAVVPGSAFGDDRYARMSIASSDAELEEGVRRMARVLGG